MADIQIANLTSTTAVTNGVADGTGVFDKLFNTVNLYIDDQYKDGRLKGPEYASVLLGSIEAVLAQSVQFVLQEQMIEAQTEEVLDGTRRANIDLNDQLVNTAKEREIKEVQKANMIAEGLNIPKEGIILDKQALDIDKGIEVKNQQIINMVDELLTSAKQRDLIDAQIEKMLKDIIIAEEQIKLLKEDILLKKQQILIAEKELDVAIAKLANIPKEGIILDKQALDIDKGIEVKEEQIKGMFAARITADKQAALLGLDQVVKTANTAPESVYTPKYEV